MSSIVLSYTRQSDSAVTTVTIKDFSGNDLPRSYVNQAAFSFSSKGTSLITGPAYKEKRIWAISAYLTKNDALLLDTLFTRWDTDRAAGYAAVVAVTDSTFGSTINANAVITTPPTFNRAGPKFVVISIGLTEV